MRRRLLKIQSQSLSASSASAETFTPPLRIEILDYWRQLVTKDLDETTLVVSKALTDGSYNLTGQEGMVLVLNSGRRKSHCAQCMLRLEERKPGGCRLCSRSKPEGNRRVLDTRRASLSG